MKKMYLVFFALAMELVGIELGFLYLGMKVEEKFPMSGLAPVIGALLGLAGWLVHLIYALKPIMKDQE